MPGEQEFYYCNNPLILPVTGERLNIEMENLNQEQTQRVQDKIAVCKQMVAQMEEDLALLMTGGLTEAQNNAIGEDDGEPIRARGIGKRAIQEMIIHRGIAPSYPLQWFQKNGWNKPTITVPEMRKNAKIGDYFAHITGEYRGGVVSPATVMVFMRCLCSLIRDTLRFDWVSMGVFIGAEGTVVSPLSVVRLAIFTQGTNVGTCPQMVTREQVMDLGLLILGCYRILCASNQTYVNKLQTTLKDQLITKYFADGIEVAMTNFATVYQSPEFVKLVCAIDMFFSMFPKHFDSKLRFGTLMTAYRDCTGLSAITSGCDLMRETTRVFARWLMTPTLRVDLTRMLVSGQKMEIPYSYSPYLSGFGLVDKSPYSASINAGFHVFSHLIGCAIPLIRSVNAIFLPPIGLHSIIDNVILYIYAHSCTGSLQMQYYKSTEVDAVRQLETDARLQTDFIRKQLLEGTEDDPVPIDDAAVAVGEDPAEEGQGAGDLNDVEDASEGDTDIGSEPISRDALEWYSYISRHYRGAIPDRMRELAWERWSKIGEARPNSVGEFAKRLSAGGKL